MADDVKFQEGTASKYASITPDEHSFYRTTDTNEVYLGTVKLSNDGDGIDLQALYDQVQELQDQLDTYIFGSSFVLFDNYTVSQVLIILDQGEAENYWSIGDVTEPIPLNGTVGAYTFNNEKYRATIIGFDHNIGVETDCRHNIALQFGQNEDGVNIAFVDDDYGYTNGSPGFRMNLSNNNSGGWASSYMRNSICQEFLEALPPALISSIGTTTKYTDNEGGGSGSVSSNVTATEDKIFLPSALEIFSDVSYVNSYEGNYTERYTWYTNNDSNSARIRYRHVSANAACYWWLRSPYRSGSLYFCSVNAGGEANAVGAYNSYGFAPCFNMVGTIGFKPLSDCTPAEIKAAIQSGEAANTWSVGDLTADIELNGDVSTYTFDHEQFKAMLIGLDHNKDIETGGKYNACFQFGQTDDGINIAFRDSNYDGDSSSSKTGFRMNSSNTNSGGWESSWMRTEILPEFLEALPAEWQAVIGTTVKYTDNKGGGSGSIESNVTATEDEIFSLAELEIFSSSSYSNTYEGNYTQRYTWYTNNNSNNARIRYKHFNTSSTSAWWLRSPYRSTSTYFCNVTASGAASGIYARGSYGFAPAFTIF